jgi:hypothetical protein
VERQRSRTVRELLRHDVAALRERTVSCGLVSRYIITVVSHGVLE